MILTKKYIKNTSTSFFCALLCCIFQVHAGDVYIDLSNQDEVVISSRELEGEGVIKLIGEPSTQVNQSSQANTQKKDQARLPYHMEVVEAAKVTSLDSALIHAVIAAESQHNPSALSKKGAFGLMQLMPNTARRYNVINRKDVKQNILAGSKYLSELIGLFNGNLELALAAYNAGPAAVQKYQNQIPPYQETRYYVPKVLKYYRQFSA